MSYTALPEPETRQRNIWSWDVISDSPDTCGRISQRTESGKFWRMASSLWTSSWWRRTPRSCTRTPGPANCRNISRTVWRRGPSPSYRDTAPSRRVYCQYYAICPISEEFCFGISVLSRPNNPYLSPYSGSGRHTVLTSHSFTEERALLSPGHRGDDRRLSQQDSGRSRPRHHLQCFKSVRTVRIIFLREDIKLNFSASYPWNDSDDILVWDGERKE